MPTQIQLRRGTTSEHSSFTGAAGEVTVDTTKKALVVHDGSTAGGIPVARDSTVVHTTGNETIAGTKTFSSDTIHNGVNVGRGAGAVSTNTAVGASALAANTTGARNTALGGETLFSNTTGSNNLAVGGRDDGAWTPLYSNTTGSFNVAVGNGALAKNTTASVNSAVGYQSLFSNTTGTENSAFGAGSLALNTTGNYNTAMGRLALNANTTASNNTAVGSQAAYSNTTGADNTAVGNSAMYANTTGIRCVAVGTGALDSNTTGLGNTSVGWGAGQASTTTDGNTFIGYIAGYLSTGTRNTFIGPRTVAGGGAGGNMTTGSSNVIIGAFEGNNGGLDIRTASNYIVLSDGDTNVRAYHDGTNWYLPSVDAQTTGGAANVNVGTNGVLRKSTSSIKYKRDVQNSTHGLNELLALRSVTYRGKSALDGETVFGGLIAEEVHAAGLTEFVCYDSEGNPNALQYGHMVSLCIKAIQELKADLDATKAELAAIKGA
jgi:hypothetical protein